MSYNEQQIEEKLRGFKEALTPSRSVAQRVYYSITHEKRQVNQGRSVFRWLRMLAPAMAVAVVVLALVVFHPGAKTPTAAADVDQIVNTMEHESASEEAITSSEDAPISIDTINEYQSL